MDADAGRRVRPLLIGSRRRPVTDALRATSRGAEQNPQSATHRERERSLIREDRRVVAGATLLRRHSSVKTRLTGTDFIDERLDHGNRVTFTNVVVQALRKQERVTPTPAFDVASSQPP